MYSITVQHRGGTTSAAPPQAHGNLHFEKLFPNCIPWLADSTYFHPQVIKFLSVVGVMIRCHWFLSFLSMRSRWKLCSLHPPAHSGWVRTLCVICCLQPLLLHTASSHPLLIYPRLFSWLMLNMAVKFLQTSLIGVKKKRKKKNIHMALFSK